MQILNSLIIFNRFYYKQIVFVFQYEKRITFVIIF